MNISPKEIEQLLAKARQAQQFAYDIKSNYKVGAALLTGDGHLFGGCNVESQAYSLTCCAERVALFKAVSEGCRQFKALAVVTPDGQTPCGACRQLIMEICGNIAIIVCKPDNTYTITDSKKLLPDAWLEKH